MSITDHISFLWLSVTWLLVGLNPRVQSSPMQSTSCFSCSGVNAVFEPEPTNGMPSMSTSLLFHSVDCEIPYCFPISQIDVLFSLISSSASFMLSSVQHFDFLVFEVDFRHLKYNSSLQRNCFLAKIYLKFMFLGFPQINFIFNKKLQ